MDTKLLTTAALAAALGAGTVYVSTDGKTFEKVIESPAPITSELVKLAPQACVDAIQQVGDDPQCSMVEAYYPLGGETVLPPVTYDENGEERPPTIAEIRALNFEKRVAWACNGAVMPASIQGCLDDAQVALEVAAEEAAIAREIEAAAALVGGQK